MNEPHLRAQQWAVKQLKLIQYEIIDSIVLSGCKMIFWIVSMMPIFLIQMGFISATCTII